MYKINTVFLKFRFRQFGKIVKEIPLLYLVALGALFSVGIAMLYQLTETKKGGLLAGSIWLLLLLFFHRQRKDFRFIELVDEHPQRIFVTEYGLLSILVLIMELLHGHFLVSTGILLGCWGIGCLKQPFHRAKKGIVSPRFLPKEAFECRSGIRRHGVLLLLIYISAYVGLLLPYASFASLWFFTWILTEFFLQGESKAILCAVELSARRFLNRKLGRYMGLYGCAVLPVCLLSVLIYPDTWLLALIFGLYGILNIALIVTSKYAHYEPDTATATGQPAITLSIFGMLFPLLLPVTLFYLGKKYRKAYHILNVYLDAYN